ncbi:MAG: hypothetical protein HY706_10085, partial [Candidatus Hydrogenedentes bacterium]|nr:hypothetical protein [Candidatus Hydrogenedentota bacterium]
VERHEHPSGGRNVGFADGHVEFIRDPKDWDQRIAPYLKLR